MPQATLLAAIRSAARSEYFGYNEPGEVHYLEGTGGITSRERRFLGWFALTYRLKDGRCPAELAAEAFFSGDELISAIDSIRNCRYVLVMVAMVTPGRGLILKLEDEEFAIENHQLSRMVNRDESLYAHIVPAGRHGWLVGPGWLQWPIRILPGMQAALKDFQLSPIELERLLQQRKDSYKDLPKEEMPRDSSLKAAVDRMTKSAKAEGHQDLVMTPTQWKKLVLSHMKSSQVNGFIREITERVGEVKMVEELNSWLGMAMNIWNNTPQPDREGQSPFELSQEYNMPSGD
ncbi:hypothetical protein ACFLWO_04210 [Chloroflexota bacterium]